MFNKFCTLNIYWSLLPSFENFTTVTYADFK